LAKSQDTRFNDKSLLTGYFFSEETNYSFTWDTGTEISGEREGDETVSKRGTNFAVHKRRRCRSCVL